jgi:hypothetical protein
MRHDNSLPPNCAVAAETWRPSAGFLPAWLQIGICVAVVLVFFLLTGALPQLSVNAGDEIELVQTYHRLALQARHDFIRSTTLFHTWRKRIGKRRGPSRE